MSQYAKWETLWEQIVFPLAFVVVAGIAVAIYFENRTNRRETEELRTNGITTMGSLAHSYTQRQRWGRSEYELTYTFDANGNTFSKTVTVDQPPTVSDVKIVYLPMAPNISRLVDFSRRTHWEDVLIAATVAGIIIMVTLVWRLAASFLCRFRH